MKTLFGFRHLTAAAVLAFGVLSPACNTSPQAKEAKHLRKGHELRDKKDYSRALLEFKSASLAMPKDAEPNYQLGLTYLDIGDIRSGAAYLRKATELNPKHQQAQLKLAELMATSRDQDVLQQAASRLADVLSASPDNSEATDALALAEWKMGKTDEATTRLEDTLQKFPSHLQTSVELARMKLLKKDLAGAEQVLKQAVVGAPQSSPAELALGQLYMMTNQPAKAEPELRKAIQLDPKNGTALVGLGAIQIATNRMDEAEQTYHQASALSEPEYKPLHALFLFRQGKKDAALTEFEKLVKDNPNNRDFRNRLYTLYVSMDKKDAAQNLVNAALKKNAKDTDALFERASLSMRAGNITEAEKDLK
jgi:Tfp pilus assembly protein PilF